MRRRAASSLAYLATRASKVRLVSRVMAQSAPRGSRSGATLSRSRARGLSGRWSRPRLVASRREGSMVHTSTRRPRTAACTPRAAAAVVLPTPPDPHTTSTRRSSRARERAGRGAVTGSGGLEPLGQSLDGGLVYAVGEQQRQRHDGHVHRLLEALAIELRELAAADVAAA